MKSQVKG